MCELQILFTSPLQLHAVWCRSSLPRVDCLYNNIQLFDTSHTHTHTHTRPIQNGHMYVRISVCTVYALKASRTHSSIPTRSMYIQTTSNFPWTLDKDRNYDMLSVTHYSVWKTLSVTSVRYEDNGDILERQTTYKALSVRSTRLHVYTHVYTHVHTRTHVHTAHTRTHTQTQLHPTL